MAYCSLFNRSCFLLFLDLVKAFDKIVRELVFGWPADLTGNHEAYLESIGVDRQAATWIAEYINTNGCLCAQWGVDPLVAELLCQLHQGTWLQYGSLETVIHTLRGGRQGCKVGGSVFNACYSIAIKWLRKDLVDEDCTSTTSSDEAHHIVDVQFVDDECVMLCATSPKLLDRAIAILLDHLV
eukprot:126221-Karenia_brevis.AAC.1